MAFASTQDIAARRARGDLTEPEQDAVTLLLEGATALITDSVGKTEDWAAQLDPVPKVLRFVCVEMVCRALANPDGVSSQREQLGAHQFAQTFRESGGDLYLRPHEERLCRTAVWGVLTGSSRPEGLIDEIHDVWYGS